MNTTTKNQLGIIYAAVFGLIVLGFGLVELILGLTGGCLENELFIICDQEDFLLWRGLILTSAGLFYLTSVTKFSDIHQQAKALLGSLMIWIVGGIGIIGLVLGAIPGPEDGAWFNTLPDFIASFAPPYIPSLLLLPVSLLILAFVSIKKKKQIIEE